MCLGQCGMPNLINNSRLGITWIITCPARDDDPNYVKTTDDGFLMSKAN